MVDKVIALVKPISSGTGPFRAIPVGLTACVGVGYLFVSSLALLTSFRLAAHSLTYVYLSNFLIVYLM